MAARQSKDSDEGRRTRCNESTRAQRLATAARLFAEIIPLDKVTGYYPSLWHESSDGEHITRTVIYPLPDLYGNWIADITVNSLYGIIGEDASVSRLPGGVTLYLDYGAVEVRGTQSDRSQTGSAVRLEQTLFINPSGPMSAHTQFMKADGTPTVHVVDDQDPTPSSHYPELTVVHPLGIDPTDSAQQQVRAVVGAMLRAYDFGISIREVEEGFNGGER